MKKRVLCAALASMMALFMTACSSGSTATTAAETKASEAETTTEAASSEAEETTAAAAGTEGGTLIVSTWNWHRKLQSVWVWNIRRSQLHGMQKIWNWSLETLTVSGMDLL